MLDGNARLNLATFVSTWMEPQAQLLMAATFDKNMIDKDEYPRTAELEQRCVNMLSRLWHSPDEEEATGTSTTGSSEAAMLAGMALKWRWRERQRAAGKPSDQPNMVMGANVQVCWEKFCRYWEVEARLVPMEGTTYHLTAEQAAQHCDENTIGVVAVLGSTFDGSYEPIADICRALDTLQASTGLDVPVHVDGASGGFVAPFIDPDLEWDFRLPRVQSINASGHKYGLVYPGVGWIIWRNPDALPEDLVFNVNYLGGNMPTFALNFSRPGNQVAAQYYNFIRLGFDGYKRVQQTSRDVARYTVGRDRQARRVRAADRRQRPARLRVRAPRHRRSVHGVRRLGAAPRPRLDRTRVHLPREPPGPRRAPGRRAQRVLARPGRSPGRRSAAPRRLPGEAADAAPAIGPRGVPPLSVRVSHEGSGLGIAGNGLGSTSARTASGALRSPPVWATLNTRSTRFRPTIHRSHRSTVAPRLA